MWSAPHRRERSGSCHGIPADVQQIDHFEAGVGGGHAASSRPSPSTMQRRTFIRTSTCGLLVSALTRSRAGEPVNLAQAFDAEVEAFMEARGIPGGALAVGKDRRVVHA